MDEVLPFISHCIHFIHASRDAPAALASCSPEQQVRKLLEDPDVGGKDVHVDVSLI